MKHMLFIFVIVSFGCERIDFVEVEQVRRGHVLLWVEHGDSLIVNMEAQFATETAPAVSLNGSVLDAQKVGDRWLYRTVMLADSLNPELVLEIETEQRLQVVLPVVARNGSAIWQPDGDLELPLVQGGLAMAGDFNWQVALVDSSGKQIFTISSRSNPLPTPMMLQDALVPDGAASAEINTQLSTVIEEQGYPINIAVNGNVEIPIPVSQ